MVLSSLFFSITYLLFMAYNDSLTQLKHCNIINKISIIGNNERVTELIQKNLMTLEFYTKALSLYQVANEVYPDNCDLHLFRNKIEGTTHMEYRFAIIIRFPEITVTNSNKAKVVMNDFFYAIQLAMSGSEIIIERTMGERMTYSYLHAVSSYKFSHLSGGGDLTTNPRFCHFCYGDGDIPLLVTKFNNVAPRDMGIFRLFLFNIESYLSWESLEGGPYIRISQIHNQINLYDSSCMNDGTRKVYIERLMRHISELDSNIVIKNGIYLISDDSVFNDSIVKIISSHFSSNDQKRLLFRKGVDGNLYQINSQSRRIMSLSTHPYIFQQREYYYTISNTSEEVEKSEIFYINPEFKTHVKSTIEYQLNQKIIEANFIKQLQDQIEI